jgi:GNAT superfamily N-acetyltransferase
MSLHNMIDYRENLPLAEDFFTLFATTGWNQTYDFTAEDLFAALKQSWYLVAAYDQAELVGSGRIISDGVFHALIVEMIIRPDYQGRGIGSAIMQRLLAKCRAKRIRDVQLFCARGKQGFYKRFGFEERPFEAPGMQLKRESVNSES